MGKIVWLASYPRSGNTWLRAFLHNYLRNTQQPYDINRLRDFTLLDSDARWYQELAGKPVVQLSKEEVAALRPQAQEGMTKAFPDTVFVKTHNALVEDRGTPMIAMAHTAGAIYVVRNPLDLVISYAEHFGQDLDAAIERLNGPRNQSVANQQAFVYELHGSWSENVASWTGRPQPGLHVMRYEDMLEKPKEAFGRLVAFLGFKAAEERLDRAIENSRFDILKEQERRAGFRERSLKSETFFRRGAAGVWRDSLNADQVTRIVAAHKAQMTRFGYWPPADSPAPP